MKKGLDAYIYYIIFFVPIMCILYGFGILAMHYILGFIPIIITVIVFIILSIKKINSVVKDYAVIILLSLSIISVPISHIAVITNPFAFRYKNIEGGVELTGYDVSFINDYDKEFILEIPSKIMNKQVKSIGVDAFAGSKFIKELIIPEGVEQVKRRAFIDVDYEKLVLPETLKVIENYAFHKMCRYEEKIDIIVLPKSLVYVGESAFGDAAKSIFIPKSEEVVYNIEKWSPNWHYFHVDIITNYYYNIINFQVIENVMYVLLSDKTAVVSIIYDAPEITILEKIVYNDIEYVVQSIDACAGAFSTFKEINIPSTIKEIKKFAFSNNKSITSIYIPKNVLYMGERIFTGCLNVVVNIEHSEVPSSWDEYWKTSNVSVKLNCSS